MTYTEEEAREALELARVILAKPKIVAGLTPTQSKICHVLKAAGGRVVSHAEMARACGAKSENSVVTQVSILRAKRPDIGAHIVASRARGERKGYRWEE